MKKIQILFSVAFFFAIATSTFATSTDTNSGYLNPEQANLGFTVKLNENGNVETSWDVFEGDLLFYKLIRSQENTDPYYPEDGYIFYSADKNVTEYLDNEVPSGKNYYRLCAITNQKERLCSGVLTIDKKDTSFCIQMIQAAKNPETGECKEFPTPCDVPDGWENVSMCTDISSSKISLSAERNGTEINLSWQLEGNAPKGFKIVKSTRNLEPTYPLKEGDSYEYLTNPNIRSYTDKSTTPGQNYYYRACIYDGNICGPYSNAVSVKIPDNTPSSNIEEEKVSFSDIKNDDWYSGFVQSFVDRKIVEGYSDGTFRPATNVNRAEMAKIVANFKGEVTQAWDSQIFCDVPTTAWFHTYVMDLYYKNIVSGFVGGNCSTNREFRASKALTRAEAIKIIMSLFEIETPTLSTNENTGFSDIKASDWVAPYVKKAFELGIVQGFEDGTFKPEANVNRAEFVKMLAEAEEKLGN